MNYKNVEIFQVYLNERVRCDVQAAFLGRSSVDVLIKVISYISRYVDLYVSIELNVSNLDTLKTYSDIVRAQ